MHRSTSSLSEVLGARPAAAGLLDVSVWFKPLEAATHVVDLIDLAALLRARRRVGRAGCISSPSRLSEQTRGVRDRVSRRPGHRHRRSTIDPLDQGLRFSTRGRRALKQRLTGWTVRASRPAGPGFPPSAAPTVAFRCRRSSSP